jgi:hypothetical protein
MNTPAKKVRLILRKNFEHVNLAEAEFFTVQTLGERE